MERRPITRAHATASSATQGLERARGTDRRALPPGLFLGLAALACGPAVDGDASGDPSSSATRAPRSDTTQRSASDADADAHALRRSGDTAGSDAKPRDKQDLEDGDSPSAQAGVPAESNTAAMDEDRAPDALGTFTPGQRWSSWSPAELVIPGRSSLLPPFEPPVLRELSKFAEAELNASDLVLGGGTTSILIIVTSAEVLEEGEVFEHVADLQALWPRWPTTTLALVVAQDLATGSTLTQRAAVRRILRRTHLPVLVVDASTSVRLAAGKDHASGTEAASPLTDAKLVLPARDEDDRCRVVVVDATGEVVSNTPCSHSVAEVHARLAPPAAP